MNINISNNGGLGTEYNLKSIEDDLENVFTIASRKSIAPYSSILVPITFSPKQIGLHKANLKLGFKNHEDISMEIEAACDKVPIYVENEIIDFQCVLSDKLYRSGLIVKNRGNVSMKVWLV